MPGWGACSKDSVVRVGALSTARCDFVNDTRDDASAGAVGSVIVPMGLWYCRLCSIGYWWQGVSSQGRLRISEAIALWCVLARVAVAPTASRPTVLYCCDTRLLYPFRFVGLSVVLRASVASFGPVV